MSTEIVTSLNANAYDDVSSTADRLRSAFERHFKTPTTVEATYPWWHVLVRRPRSDAEWHAMRAWVEDWLFDLAPPKRLHATRKLPKRQHATRKTPVKQLEREINAALSGKHARSPSCACTACSGHATKKVVAGGSRRIERRKLASMMAPWGSDFSYGQGSGAIGAVASYYFDGKKYPDRQGVERAIAQVEADAPLAERAAHGWTRADAQELRRIAAGLRYYLKHDYAAGA